MEETVVGNPDGASLGDMEGKVDVDGVIDGNAVGVVEGAGEVLGAEVDVGLLDDMLGEEDPGPKIVTSENPKSPPEATSFPFKVTLYDPNPQLQQIPSPNVSLIVKE